MDIKHACIVLLSCLCLLIACAGFGQEYSYRQYTTKDGLAAETVYGITQDRNGFLWIGTTSGLSRFDGRMFENFTIVDGLPSNEVFNMVEDNTNRLWILSFSNEVVYYKNGKIHSRKNDSLLREFIFPAMVKGLIEDTEKRILAWDVALNVTILDKSGRIKKFAPGTYQLDYHQLPINSSIYIDLLNLPKQVIQGINEMLINPWVRPKDIIASRISNEKFLIKGIDKAIVWDTHKQMLIKVKHYEDEMYYHKVWFSDKLISLSTKSLGAALYDLNQLKKQAVYLNGNNINEVFKDRDGNLWFSTNGNGLFKLNYMPVRTYGPSRFSIPVQFIINDGKSVWVGTEHNDFFKFTPAMKAAVKCGFPELSVATIKTDKQYLIKKIAEYPVKIHQSFFSKEYIGSIKTAFFAGNQALITTSNGFFLSRDANLALYDTILLQRGTTGMKYGKYYFMGTSSGLLILDQSFRKVNTLTSYHITHISPGADSVLWVSTYGNGILKVKDNKVVAVINSKNNGISSDFCNYVYADGSYLWAGTNKGLNKIDTKQPVPRTTLLVTSDNGLRSDVVTTVLVKDTLVFVGTQKGLNIFNQRMAGQAPFFNFLFTAITVDNHSLPVDEAIILPHGNNKISFDFTAISFSAENIIYHYRILGLQDEWQETTERELYFLSLPSGKYTLQVKAVSALGGQTSLIEKQFEVQQSIYETWWFRAMALLALGALIYLFLKYRIRKVRRQEAEKSELNRKMTELEQMALRAQMNPHFIFNCLNSVQNYIFRNDSMGASIYLSRFATLIRKTLDNAGSLYIPLKEELAYLESYIELEQLQANNPFTYTIEVASSINTATTAFPNMILQPYVENAIKHGMQYAGVNARLIINFTMKEGTQLVCRIEDNGPGIYVTAKKSTTTHHSKGMQITAQRMATLNQLNDSAIPIVLLIEDLAGSGSAGTRISVTVPLKTI